MLLLKASTCERMGIMRFWAKKFKDNRLLGDITIENNDINLSRTGKIFDSLSAACRHFDLAEPIWFDSAINEFKRRSKTRFYQDAFIEEIDFDFLEIQIIEE